MPSFKHQRSRGELLDILQRQIGHLRRSAEVYDEGVEEEAERLATSVYTLVHDGKGRTVSLLTQLNLRKALQIEDTSHGIALTPGREGFRAPDLCLILLGEGPPKCVPSCLAPAPDQDWPVIPLSRWWEGRVFSTTTGLTISRKNVTFALRAQDGGAHVDGELRNEAYHWMRVDIDPKVRGSSGSGQKEPLGNAHWATMRQIAWELDRALQKLGY